MMQGDDIRNQRRKAEEINIADFALETHVNLALWVIAEQLFEVRAIAATFQEALQVGFGERDGYIRIRQEEKR